MKKKTFSQILPFTLTLVFFCNCSSPKKEFHEIDVYGAVNAAEQIVPVSYVSETVNYLPLETTHEALLQGIYKVLCHDNHFYISDNRKVFQFNDNGKFIRQFGAIGKGPGEYSGMIRFTLDTVNKELLIHSQTTNILNVYRLDNGEFKHDRLISFIVSDLSCTKNGQIVYFTADINKKVSRFTLNEVYLLDQDKNIADSITNANRNNFETHAFGYVNQHYGNNNINYQYNFRDTLYQLDASFTRKPLAIFQLGNTENGDNLQMTFSEDIQYPDFLWISRVLACGDHLFMIANKGFLQGSTMNQNHLIYNKNTGKIQRMPYLQNSNGLPFWPRWVQDDMMISYHHAYEIIDFYSTGDGKDMEKPDWYHSIDENSNPVLVLVNN